MAAINLMSVKGGFAAQTGDLVLQDQLPPLHFRDLQRVGSGAGEFSMDFRLKSRVTTLKLL